MVVANIEQLRLWPAGTSPEYIAAREELLRAEIELRDHIDQVAAQRRALPLGAALPEYVFAEGPRDLTKDGPVQQSKLSDLASENRSLVIYHMMFDPRDDEACPMCSMWVDSLYGVSHHLAQRVDFAVISKAQLPKLRGWARKRGWDGLRILSSYDSTFNADFGMEDERGYQQPGTSVFVKRDGVVHHFYTGHAQLEVDNIERGMDLLVPVWHVWDLIPEGRGDWYSSNSYAGRERG